MTEPEIVLRHFNSKNQRRCKKHNQKFVLAWDGTWSITCGHEGKPESPACAIHDPDNRSATPIQTAFLQSEL